MGCGVECRKAGLVAAWRSCPALWGILPFPGYRILLGVGCAEQFKGIEQSVLAPTSQA